jgi:UDP-N-acetylmuramate dehydrogenase
MITKYTDYPLQSRHTFGMDVKTRLWVEYDTVDDLRQLLAAPDELPRPWLCIGGGSNLLFGGDYPGTMLHSAIRGYEVTHEDADTVTVKVGAGEVWDDLVAYTLQQGWSGAENLSLIPGEVGASAVQNIGAYGLEAKDLIQEVFTVEVATGQPRVFRVEECAYGYRDSVFKRALKGRYIVTHVSYRLSKIPVYRLDYGNIRAELEKRLGPIPADVSAVPNLSPALVRQVIIDIRRAKLPDPKEEGNAGSFFMNPVVDEAVYTRLLGEYPDMPHYPAGPGKVKIPAAWLIDRAGWKGRTVGHAGVHHRQALVLVNRGGATGQEVMHLAEQICQSVKKQFGVEIHPEVNYVMG